MSSLTAIYFGKQKLPVSWPARMYERICSGGAFLHTPFRLAVRPYWGWQLVPAGLGNVHLVPIPDFFRSQGILLPNFNAQFLEFIGGLLLIAGLASRLTGFLLADAIFVAYWTGHRESLLSVFSEPGEFYEVSRDAAIGWRLRNPACA